MGGTSMCGADIAALMAMGRRDLCQIELQSVSLRVLFPLVLSLYCGAVASAAGTDSVPRRPGTARDVQQS